MFLINTLGNGEEPVDSLWLPIYYQDSLRTYINDEREAKKFDRVSMNTSDQITYQAKLSWRISPKIKFSYNNFIY